MAQTGGPNSLSYCRHFILASKPAPWKLSVGGVEDPQDGAKFGPAPVGSSCRCLPNLLTGGGWLSNKSPIFGQPQAGFSQMNAGRSTGFSTEPRVPVHFERIFN